MYKKLNNSIIKYFLFIFFISFVVCLDKCWKGFSVAKGFDFCQRI